MAAPSHTHLVMIPTFNTGDKVFETVRNVRRFWDPVWIVVDGSTDGTAVKLQALAATDAGLRVFVLPHNQGKGAAILHGLRAAVAHGFTHVLTIDADGQHPAGEIPAFMQVSRENPGALVLGRPVFDASAPRIRIMGRQISNWCTNLETLWEGIGDSLFGMRVYPAQPLLEIMETIKLCYITINSFEYYEECVAEVKEEVELRNMMHEGKDEFKKMKTPPARKRS